MNVYPFALAKGADKEFEVFDLPIIGENIIITKLMVIFPRQMESVIARSFISPIRLQSFP
jgi:hypothetical protein